MHICIAKSLGCNALQIVYVIGLIFLHLFFFCQFEKKNPSYDKFNYYRENGYFREKDERKLIHSPRLQLYNDKYCPAYAD